LRTIAIGDIHGCHHALRTLLDHLVIEAEDQLIFLGDYVDRGPESRQVIDTLLELEAKCRCVFLMGNHEQVMLSCLSGFLGIDTWQAIGGQATLDSYGGIEHVPESHRRFLGRLVPYYEIDTHFFVHANYEADLPLDQQPPEVLYWQHLVHRIPPPHENGKIAIVGHTPQMWGRVADLGHLVCIDTYCFGGGWLTAWEVHSRQMWQVSYRGKVRSQKPSWFSTISAMVRRRSDENDSNG
jgi:serine/threonine protein phosphatase 1